MTTRPATSRAAARAAAPDRDAAAACRSHPDPDIFFPRRGQSPKPAQKVCRGCPIRAGCGEWALSRPERFGVWGGMTERRRRQIRRARAAGVPPPATSPPGEIPPLVAEHLHAHPDVAFTVAQVARTIGRHPRSVENTLKAMVTAGRARLISEGPRRYAAPGTEPVTMHVDTTRTPNGDVTGQVRRHMLARPGLEQFARQVASALPDLNPRSVAQALARLAAQGELTQLPGRPARYLAPAQAPAPGQHHDAQQKGAA